MGKLCQTRFQFSRFSWAFTLLLTTSCASNHPIERCQASIGGTCSQLFQKSDIQVPTGHTENLKLLRQVLRKLADVPSITWESKVLRTDAQASPERVTVIVDQLLKKDSRLSQEVVDLFKKLQAEDASQIWNIYFKVYDKLMTFSDGYVDIFIKAHQHLAEQGLIVDYGAGSGNGSIILASLAPKRKILGIDGSADGLAVAEKKFAAVQASGNFTLQKPEFMLSDLRTSQLPAETVHGALMSNVLYALPEVDQLPMLKRIFAELKPGGRLVLNDPRDFIQNDLSKLKKFLNSVAKSAARNDSPMTEFDVAFIGAVNLQFLVGGKTKFLSTTELQALASQAGFQVEQTYDTYYGAATMLILRKP